MQSNSMDKIKTQLSGIGSQVQSYLKDVTIETYKFNINQVEGGINIDIEFRARFGKNSTREPLGQTVSEIPGKYEVQPTPNQSETQESETGGRYVTYRGTKPAENQ
jgi:hypothetical protein